MQKVICIIFKILKQLLFKAYCIYYKSLCYIIFYINDVKIKSFVSHGIPYIHKSLNASITIGNNFKMNNGARYSDSGLNGKCRIEVRDSAILRIGDNVGISDVTITCHQKITIGNNVIIGVGTQIRDTDNHSLNPLDRLNGQDWKNKITRPITIGDNVFIGTNCIILKGINIGNNVIIGAGSIVTKNIPPNQIWAGNPAKSITK